MKEVIAGGLIGIAIALWITGNLFEVGITNF